MYRRAYIKQPAGLGDIFYCLKIAQTIKAEEVIWPISDTYYDLIKKHIIIDVRRNVKFVELPPPEEVLALWNSEYNSPYYFCTSEDVNQVQPQNNKLFLPLQHADRVYPDIPIMLSKYKLANSSSDDWLKYFNFKRDHQKENELFEHLGLSENEEYALVSHNYGTPPNFLVKPVPYENKGIKEVKLDFIDGFNVFDWCKVLEQASEIHMLETCFIYITEKLNLKANELNLWSRRGPDKCEQISFIPKNVNWTYN